MASDRTYTKTITNKEKFTAYLETESTSKAIYTKWSAFGSDITIYASTDYTSQQETDLDTFVNNFVDYTDAENLYINLHNNVFPFITKLLHTFSAENIDMGITSDNKTGPVLGLFSKKYDIHSDGLPISLKDAFDAGALNESLTVITHLRDNSDEFTGLSPYVTDTRLLSLMNKVETFLEITLST